MGSHLFARPAGPMQSIRSILAIGLARMLKFGLRLLGRGATALPGKAALAVDPGLLARLTAQRMVFLVTGTNGKTTTVRILSALLRSHGYDIITNPSGANLDSGLTTTLIDHLNLLKKNGRLALVFEIDEAFFGKLAAELNPTVSVVTNFFRDQLDRFGELQHTRDLIAKGLDESGARVVLCADDSLCASLARGREDKTQFFGMADAGLQSTTGDAIHESAFCTFCGGKYEYDGMVYGHLGRFHCPGCGYSRPKTDLSFLPADLDGKSLRLSLDWHGTKSEAILPIPGIHNGYNAAAALLAVLSVGLPWTSSVAALKNAEAAFGRMERFQAGEREVCLILVKNPVGMDRALDFVAVAPDSGGVMMLLNSNDPDGRDVSWIWDVNFENHLPDGPIGVSGVRCHDLALRLYYAGKSPDELMTDPAHAALFERMLADCPPGRCLYILPNYTAMLALRADLAKRFQLRDFWR